jgi:hypothetical protein
MSVKPCWVGPAIAAGSAPREPRRHAPRWCAGCRPWPSPRPRRTGAHGRCRLRGPRLLVHSSASTSSIPSAVAIARPLRSLSPVSIASSRMPSRRSAASALTASGRGSSRSASRATTRGPSRMTTAVLPASCSRRPVATRPARAHRRAARRRPRRRASTAAASASSGSAPSSTTMSVTSGLPFVSFPVLASATARTRPRATPVVRSAPVCKNAPRWDIDMNVTSLRGGGATMRKRILVVTAAMSLALGMWAGSALAHPNEAAGTSVGPPAHATPSGLGHAGMECGAENPNTPLVPLGLSCPAP